MVRFSALKLCITLFFASLLISNWLWASYGQGFSEKVLSQIELRFGLAARKRIDTWQRLIKENKDKPEDYKLYMVNSFFNQMRFESDQKKWDKTDYWATPIEFLASGGGDCEDFSIAKYFTLAALGIEQEKMRITYVKALDIDQAHMVLTFYNSIDEVPLVLDNINKRIVPANKRTDLEPMYSFNTASLWEAKELGRGERLGSSKGLPRWDEVNERMRKELEK